MIKPILIWILLISLMLSCEPDRNKSKNQIINLNLKKQIGYGDFESSRKVLFPLDSIDKIRLKDRIPVSDKFKEYVLRVYYFDEQLAMLNKWKTGQIDDKRWRVLKRVYQIDTNDIIDTSPDYKTIIAYGTLEDGSRALQIDTDLDEKLKDEKLISVDYPLAFVDDADKDYYLSHKTDYLPKVDIAVDYQLNDSLYSQSFTMQINPYNVDQLIQYMQTDDTEKAYFTSVSIPEYYSDTLQIGKHKYVIRLAGNFQEPIIRAQDARVKIAELTNKAVYKNDITYKLNDSVYLGQIPWLIDKASPNGQLISLQQLPKTTKIEKIQIGYYFPELRKSPINKQVPDDDRPITYWIWNTQSINQTLVDRMYQWQENHDDRQLVNIAYDDNRAAVKRLIDRLGVDYPCVYINPKNKKFPIKLERHGIPFSVKLNQSRKIEQIHKLSISNGDSLK
jgi:hypothetical protein